MKGIGLFVVFVLISTSSNSQTKDIVFVGNSISYFNNMPLTLQAMLDSAGEKINVYQSTFPAMQLADHVEINQNPTKKIFWMADRQRDTLLTNILSIGQKKWDFVVLQEVTTNILIPEIFKKVFLPALRQLDSIARLTGARTVIFQPYALGNYPIEYCFKDDKNVESFCSRRFESSLDEFSYAEKVIKRIAQDIEVDVVPIGQAFENCRLKYPNIDLLVDRYDQHPNPNGSYLIACLFYRYLTGRNCKAISYNGAIEKSVAQKLRKVADSVKID